MKADHRDPTVGYVPLPYRRRPIRLRPAGSMRSNYQPCHVCSGSGASLNERLGRTVTVGGGRVVWTEEDGGGLRASAVCHES